MSDVSKNKYVIFVDYGAYEGWKIVGGADTFEEAWSRSQDVVSFGNQVEIFKRVFIEVKEVEPDA